MDPRLIVLSGVSAGQTLAIDDEVITIGRHASNRLAIRDVAISRTHAKVTQDAEGAILHDLGSRHGTSVNGERVIEHRLSHGDEITICGSTLAFLVQDLQDDDGGAVHFDDSTSLGTATKMLDSAETQCFESETIMALWPPGVRRERALNALLRVGAGLAGPPTLPALAEHLLASLVEAVSARRAALLLTAAGKNVFEPSFVHHTGGGEGDPMAISRTVALRVLSQRVALMSNDVQQAEDLQGAVSLVATRARAVLCVPILVGNSISRPSGAVSQDQSHRCLGVLYLDDDRDDARFGAEDLRLMTAIAGMAAPAIANLQHLTWTESERQRLQAEHLDHDMVGESEAMRRVIALIARVARADSTVLIRGESGTGKELAAQAVHRGSDRRARPFVAINCATLSDSLLESELFGHEKGAFTGAAGRKVGKLEVADTGTVFLDEVGELPVTTQAKLLRVLQERELERVGGTRPIKIDVRVVAATNRDLEAAIKDGSFRQDLFYRLDVITITLPPLRARHADVPLLAAHFAARHAAHLKRPVPDFTPGARGALERYDWPGNVRELSNAIERALVLCADDIVRLEDLPETLVEMSGDPEDELHDAGRGYHTVLRETKKKIIKAAVHESEGNITQAAKALQLHPNYLHRLIKNLNLRAELQ